LGHYHGAIYRLEHTIMALTLEVLRQLEKAGLTNFYDENARAWLAMARDAYAYVQKGFGDAEVRPDDVAKILHPTLAIDPTLDAFLNRKKLKQKYWKRDFTDLVLDRTWSELKKGKKK